MAVYQCYDCGEFLDDDYHPSSEHPTAHALICPSCLDEFEESLEEDPFED